MMQFHKNPFAQKQKSTKIISNIPKFNEKQKLDDIKENMLNLNFKKNIEQPQKMESKPLSIKQKIDILKNINKG